MSLHQDMLDHAKFLAVHDPRKPKQANLRRAISAAYYAVFHMLTSDASAIFVKEPSLRASFKRIYSHAEMSKVAKRVRAGDLPRRVPAKGIIVPPKLRNVAEAFVELQEARHEADYNAEEVFVREDAIKHIARAEAAFADWRAIRSHDASRIFLGSFLLWKKWDEPA